MHISNDISVILIGVIIVTKKSDSNMRCITGRCWWYQGYGK